MRLINSSEFDVNSSGLHWKCTENALEMHWVKSPMERGVWRGSNARVADEKCRGFFFFSKIKLKIAFDAIWIKSINSSEFEVDSSGLHWKCTENALEMHWVKSPMERGVWRGSNAWVAEGKCRAFFFPFPKLKLKFHSMKFD